MPETEATETEDHEELTAADEAVAAAAANPDAVREALKRERTAARDARREAAQYRDRVSELESQLGSLTGATGSTPEKEGQGGVEGETAAVDSEAVPMLRRLAAREAGLDEKAARWITGSTEAEVTASARELAQLLVGVEPEHETPAAGDFHSTLAESLLPR